MNNRYNEAMLEGIVTWAEIDLDAIQYNIQAIKQFVGDTVEIFAVVKANAYGHGTIPVAKAALLAGAKRLAVHRAVEGSELRKAGITAPILVFGTLPPEAATLVAQDSLTPTVTTLSFAQTLSREAQRMGITIPVHIKVDTGMNRNGLIPEEIVAFVKEIQILPALRLEGLYTQFATADWFDHSNDTKQLEIFNKVIENLHDVGINVPLIHAANSATIASMPEAHFNAVRPGISMYGLSPSTEWQPPFELHPALTLKSRVCRLHDLMPGDAISYGRTYIADRPIRVALVPVGYGDGYPRSLSNRGWVLIHGQRAPILGLVCMDQIIVDISNTPDVQLDDEVVIIGRQGDEEISVQDIAKLANTIQNEILTSITSRVARIYLRNGKLVSVTSLSNGNHEIDLLVKTIPREFS